MRLGLLALVAVCAAQGEAQAPARDPAPGFRIDQWTTDDGLPSHTIAAISQSRDGYLWIATPGGLARFDGFAFRLYTSATTPELRENRVRAVLAGAGDTIWISLDQHGVYSIVGERVHRMLDDSRGIDYLVQDGAGRLFGGYLSLFRLSDSGRKTVALVKPIDGGPQPHSARDSAGTVWVVGDLGRSMYRLTDSGLVLGGRSEAQVVVTVPSRREVLMVRSRGTFADVVDRTGAVRATYAKGDSRIPRLIDARGTLWVTTHEGIEAWAPDGTRPIAAFALPQPAVTNLLMEDREGNIWAGTRQHGLWRIQRTAFRTIGRPEGFTEEQVHSLWRGAGSTVFALDAAYRRFRVSDDRAERLNVPAPRGAPTGYGISGGVFVDSRGTLWYGWGLRDTRGLLVGQRAEGSPIVIDQMRTPARIIEDPSRAGRIWFHDGAQVYRADPYETPIARNTWGTGGLIRDIAIDSKGTAWLPGVGANGRGRVVRIANDSVRRFTSDDGLPHNELRSAIVDRDDVVWFGTYGAGILRYRGGTFAAVTARDGLAEDIVSTILLDDADNFWMSGNRGVHRVSRAALNAFLDGRTRRVHSVAYNRRDGLRNPEASGWSATRAADDRMWFPTYDGAAVVNPAAALALDSSPPLVTVERVRANGDSVSSDSTGRLPLGRRRLEFTYTGVSLRNPAGVRFQYRLDGVDADWVDAGAARVAMYNRVGPGQYTFRVRAMNGGAVWSKADATLAIGVPPFFYETRLFITAVVAGLLGLGYGGHRYRVRDLEHRRAELNRVVQERTAALAEEKQRTEGMLRTVSAQADQLRLLDEAKSRFFANVSHEFRTPLSLILGPLEDIRDGRAGPVSDGALRKLDTVIRSGRRLVRLVEQLLDVAKLESGAMQLHAEVHDIIAYLRRTAESFASHADRHGIDFVVTCPVGAIRVRFDSDQMDKVFANLLGNAFKFTPNGGRIELRVRTEGEGDDSWAVVSVADTGAGIPAEHLSRVFDRFFQVDDSARREHEGAGIGLALTKELVELHEGQITVTSEPGTGSTFTVRLPLAIGDAKPLTPPRAVPVITDPGLSASGNGHAAAAPDAEDRTTVLLVEDNAELLEYLREHLSARYRVLEAVNGVQALAMARQHVPDLVISDIMMPEMDGQTLCQTIKADHEIDFVPVILLTAKASRESRLAGLQGGADDYLTKPVDLRELFVRAENLITTRRRLRERFREEERTLPTLLPPRATLKLDTTSEAFVRKLYEAFAKHIGDEDLEIEALASELAMSRRTLYRHVETALGRSPMDALRDYRLDQAAQWLRETDADVSEIAYGVGFKSVPHFCTRFRAKFGNTPSGYRTSTTPA